MRGCRDCGGKLPNTTGGRLSCPPCARMRNYAITDRWHRARRTVCNCQQCGTDISDRKGNARYCVPCAKRRMRDRVSAHRAIRRAKGAGLTNTRDRIYRDAVFDRDHYLCHICGLPTSRLYAVADPLSPVIDHLIPLASPHSPGHVWENTACAHRICNLQKHSKVRRADWLLHHRLSRIRKRERG